MTFPGTDAAYFCKSCEIHRTRTHDALCPVCAPNVPAPRFPGPPARMALDARPEPISTTSGDLE